MASDLPLVLYNCQFPDIKWIHSSASMVCAVSRSFGSYFLYVLFCLIDVFLCDQRYIYQSLHQSWRHRRMGCALRRFFMSSFREDMNSHAQQADEKAPEHSGKRRSGKGFDLLPFFCVWKPQSHSTKRIPVELRGSQLAHGSTVCPVLVFVPGGLGASDFDGF